MDTDQLIRTLAADNTHRARPVGFALMLALLAAGPVSLLMFFTEFGIRPDVMTAMRNPFFDLKFAVTLALAIAAIAVSLHLSRPEASLRGVGWLLLIPVGLLTAGIGGEMMMPQRLPMMTRLVMENATDGQAKELVNRAHPFAVARGEVIVDGDHMDAAPGERVEIDGQGGDERLAFAGGHFRDAPAVQRVAADELHVERHHLPPERMAAHDDILAAQAAAGVLHHGKGFGENLAERRLQFDVVLDGRAARLPFGGLLAQRVVGL